MAWIAAACAEPSQHAGSLEQPPPALSKYADPSQGDDTFPSDDSFYQPPPLDLQPGDVLRSRRSLFSLDPIDEAAETDVTAQQVLYRSMDALGQPMAVSGTILVPNAPWTGPGERPLVSYAVGTRGLGDNCAPSYTLVHGVDYEGSIIRSLLDEGWAVAITDYQGLGTPGVHTYMVGPAEGHAVLDIARAAQRLDGTGLSTSTPIGLMGYSQGGGAAGWAAQLAASYAPELNVKGSAIGGVPGDLAATAEFLDGTAFVAFALMASLGLDAAYPELNLDSYLNDVGRQAVMTGQTVCIATVDGFGALLGDFAFTSFADYTTTNPLQAPPWQARLTENKLGAAKPSAPVYQYHSLLDEIVPFDQAADLRRTWCDQGADLTWDTLPAEHALGIALGPPFAIDWLADRFADQPTSSNCQDP
ncbi:MAG TPA: lipase family protein [Polyangiaceae bacterium]|nr:lipase family protein [Polyangiaceae bacterium]